MISAGMIDRLHEILRQNGTAGLAGAELLEIVGNLELLNQIENAALPQAVQRIADALPEAKAQWAFGNTKVCSEVIEWCDDLLLALRRDREKMKRLTSELADARQSMDDFKRAASLGEQPIQGPAALTAEVIRLRALVEEERGQYERSVFDLKSAINRLHRRCQEAEGVAAVKTEKQPGPSMARSMLRWHNGQLQRELAASKERAEAYAVQCGQLQRETERMDRELGEAKAENQRLRCQLIAEQRKKEALRDCGAGSLATGKEPCKSCVKCCLKELEGANDLRRELIELQTEKNRLRQVAANLDDVNGFWEAVRGMTLGDSGRPVVARLMLTMAAIDNWRSCMCGECSCDKCGPILGPRYSVKSQGDLIASDRRNQGRRVFLTIAPATATHCGTDTSQQNRCSRLFFQHGNWFCSFVESSFLEGGKDGQKIPSRLRQCISAELGDSDSKAAQCIHMDPLWAPALPPRCESGCASKPVTIDSVCDICKNALPPGLWMFFTSFSIDVRRAAGQLIETLLRTSYPISEEHLKALGFRAGRPSPELLAAWPKWECEDGSVWPSGQLRDRCLEGFYLHCSWRPEKATWEQVEQRAARR